MKIGVIRFPGTNNELETIRTLNLIKNLEGILVTHSNPQLLEKCNGAIIAGGFSYGDYLRTGAIAANSEVMDIIKDMNNDGKPILGICNGFQILTEAKILDGLLLRNERTRFISKWVQLIVSSENSFFTKKISNKILKLPIAHNEGNYYHPDIDKMKSEGRIILQYTDQKGNITKESNPNGSMENIAGISNKAGNVLGMMPHPERASVSFLGSKDGLEILKHFAN